MFGERLQSLRKEKGLTQKDIADILKVAPSTIGMYEQGRRDPDTDTIRLLAEFFNVSIDYLLGNAEKLTEQPISLTIKEQQDLDEEAKKLLQNLAIHLSQNKQYFKAEDYEVLGISVRSAIETIALKNKIKYTPKKYRKLK